MRPAHTALVTRPPCGWCALRPERRRGLCRCCYRKAKDAGLLPPRRASGPAPRTPDARLYAFVRALPEERRPLMARLLAEAMGAAP